MAIDLSEENKYLIHSFVLMLFSTVDETFSRERLASFVENQLARIQPVRDDDAVLLVEWFEECPCGSRRRRIRALPASLSFIPPTRLASCCRRGAKCVEG